jgi:LPS-assembly protein
VRPALRLLPLPLCIAMSLAARAQDDMPANFDLCPINNAVPEFAEATGTTGTSADRASQPTNIEGDEAEGVEGEVLNVHGNVLLTRGDQFLGAEKLSYNAEDETYVAEGSIRYQDAGMRLVAERAEGNQRTDEHQIENLRYQLVSRRGNGGAERITLDGTQGSLHHSTFTTCDPDDRDWELRAQRIDIDTAEGMGVARNATLHIGKVPVLYVPWFMFPVDDRRRTGLLYPSLSNSSRNGFEIKQPVYLNLAPNYDATITPRVMTERGAMLGSEFRYLVPKGRGILKGAWMPNDKLRDIDRGHGQFDAVQNLTRHWQARANLLWISDPRYFEDFNSSSSGLSATRASSTMGIYGRGRYWAAGLGARHHQLADYTLNEAFLPYHQLPRAYFAWQRPVGKWFETGLDAEATHFAHEVRDGGTRLDFKPFVALPLEGAGWFVEPKLAWRHTQYQLDDGLADTIALQRARAFAGTNGVPVTDALVSQFHDATPSRSLPIASVDAGLFFDRDMRWRGDDYLQTLEPRLYYLYAPFRDQAALPVFDTGLMTFSWGQLFRDNRYSGADRQTDANQVTVALTSRMIRQDNGREYLSASVGQIQYLDDTRVVLGGERPIERGKSAWVASVDWAPSDRWDIGASYQWDPKFRREDLIGFRARYLLPDEGVVNLGYRYRRDLIEQADVSFLYPLNDSWSVVGRHYYSLLDRKPLETIAGVQWDSCCIAVRLVGRRYIRNREGDLNRGFMLEIELKGLGSAGQDTRRTLRRAILGYNRDDLYLVPPQTVTSDIPSDSDPTP